MDATRGSLAQRLERLLHRDLKSLVLGNEVLRLKDGHDHRVQGMTEQLLDQALGPLRNSMS